MNITADVIKQLRETTGAGIVDVKQALEEAAGDHAKAIELLRKKGKSAAAKKSERTASEGAIGSYVHTNGKVAAFVALACETDFVARNADFQELAHDLALHITAAQPAYLRREHVPLEVIAQETDIVREQLAAEKKPEAVMEKIIAGKLEKYYEKHCLLEQLFVKEDTLRIRDLLESATARLGEKIEIRNFVRFTL